MVWSAAYSTTRSLRCCGMITPVSGSVWYLLNSVAEIGTMHIFRWHCSPSHVLAKSIFVFAFLTTVCANFRLRIFQVSNPVVDSGVWYLPTRTNWKTKHPHMYNDGWYESILIFQISKCPTHLVSSGSSEYSCLHCVSNHLVDKCGILDEKLF